MSDAKHFLIQPALLISTLIGFSAEAMALAPQCPDIASSDDNLSASATIVGSALDPSDNTLLYCEYHYPELPNGRQFLVEYRDSAQALIAQKKLSYSGSLLQPQVRQEDFRHGEQRQVLLSRDANGHLNIEVQYKKPDAENIKKADLKLSDSLVIDAGFDEAIRQSWIDLIAGQTVKMDFLSPVHLKTFNLSITKTTDKNYLVKREGYSEQVVSFLIRPSNSFISLFAKPLLLSYDLRTRRLLSYNGNVNITDEDGATMEATIQYYYRN
ncbi:MAG: hypothetical protein ACRBBR_06365 [Cellvibrionaceae bacterium]